MTNREQTQAELLDLFRLERTDNPNLNPPAGLDAGVAAMAVLLEDQLSPPKPSARFVQNLGRRLEAEASNAGNDRKGRILPALLDQTIPPSTPPNTPPTDSYDEPRRPWIHEAARIAAAGLAIALVGTILMLLFRNADDVVAPGAGETKIHTGEILVSWDPNGGEDYKLFVVHTDSGELRKLTPGPAEADGVSERFASWSPDGQQVVFMREEGGQSDIFVMNADGSGTVNLTQNPFNDTVPDMVARWNPNCVHQQH